MYPGDKYRHYNQRTKQDDDQDWLGCQFWNYHPNVPSYLHLTKTIGASGHRKWVLTDL